MSIKCRGCAWIAVSLRGTPAPIPGPDMSTPPPRRFLESASRWLGRDAEAFDVATQKVVDRADQRRIAAEEPNQRIEREATLGERMADRVAQFGGSWTFISLFAGFLFGCMMVGWTLLNTEVLGRTAFDPYPYIFLNLVLSMLAAIQAPIIMMSQNRQATKDRQMASFDYEVNLKAELEIMALHEKLDALRSEQVMTLLEQQRLQIEQQRTQIELLTRLLARDAGCSG